MKKTIIGVFATEYGFNRFLGDHIMTSENISYVHFSEVEQVRGRELNGYIVHYSADVELQMDINRNHDKIMSRIK